MYAQFERFEIQITKAQALQGSHPGPCDADIQELLAVPSIRRQFKKIDPDMIRAELSEYGAWDEEELNNIPDNQERILWIACGDIRDELYIKGKS
jgi:hypothetical protein